MKDFISDFKDQYVTVNKTYKYNVCDPLTEKSSILEQSEEAKGFYSVEYFMGLSRMKEMCF